MSRQTIVKALQAENKQQLEETLSKVKAGMLYSIICKKQQSDIPVLSWTLTLAAYESMLSPLCNLLTSVQLSSLCKETNNHGDAVGVHLLPPNKESGEVAKHLRGIFALLKTKENTVLRMSPKELERRGGQSPSIPMFVCD